MNNFYTNLPDYNEFLDPPIIREKKPVTMVMAQQTWKMTCYSVTMAKLIWLLWLLEDVCLLEDVRFLYLTFFEVS